MADFGERPRLRARVQARRHVIAGDPAVILTDPESGAVLEIDEASWTALTLADGTRDLDAICLALAQRGLYRGEADARQLLSELADAGVLEDGLPAPRPQPTVTAAPVALERPIEPLPDFVLDCDGRGGCCRTYGSVPFTPIEAMRARVIAEDLALPLDRDALFTPLAGAQYDEASIHAVAQIEGGCVFLDPDGRCGLHRAAGASAKPFACRLYPAFFMDDGETIRVSVGPECACIFASVGAVQGEPIVPMGARVLGDLDAVRVMRVPDPVPLTARTTVGRSELARWSRALCDRLLHEPLDAAALAWSLADRIAANGLAPDVAAAPIERAAVSPWIDMLRSRVALIVARHESWRSPRDLSRRTARLLADALEQVDVAALATPRDSATERFYLRALTHGHRLAVEGRPLVHGLRDRAVRILAARAIEALGRAGDPAERYPLALVEAAMRNLAIAGYADEAIDR